MKGSDMRIPVRSYGLTCLPRNTISNVLAFGTHDGDWHDSTTCDNVAAYAFTTDTVSADRSTVVRCQILFIRIEFDLGHYSGKQGQ